MHFEIRQWDKIGQEFINACRARIRRGLESRTKMIKVHILSILRYFDLIHQRQFCCFAFQPFKVTESHNFLFLASLVTDNFFLLFVKESVTLKMTVPHIDQAARRCHPRSQRSCFNPRRLRSEIRGGRSGSETTFPPISFVSLSTHEPTIALFSSITAPRRCDSPDQATLYHNLEPYLEALSVARHLAALGVKIV